MIKISDALSSFYSYLEIEKNYSSLTIQSYCKDLSQWRDYLADEFNIIDISQVHLEHIRSFISNLKSQQYENTSILRKSSSIKSLFSFLIKKKYIKDNPSKGLILPKRKKTLPAYLDINLLDNLDNYFNHSNSLDKQLEFLIFYVFYNTGMRRSELIHLKVSDVDFYENKMNVLGKGNKVRIIPISEKLSQMMKKYLMQKEKNSESIYFFTSSNGKPLYEKKVYLIIKKILTAISSTQKRSPHVLRHTFATHLLNKGAGINDIKELLGHSSLASTQIYTHTSIEILKKTFKRFHPKS